MKILWWRTDNLKEDAIIAFEMEKGIIDYVCREIENETKDIE